jgi:hypothetical protein
LVSARTGIALLLFTGGIVAIGLALRRGVPHPGPSVSVSPTSIASGGGIVVQMAGFTPNATAFIYAVLTSQLSLPKDEQTNIQISPSAVALGSTGAGEWDGNTPGLAAGNYTIFATDSTGLTAYGNPFTVT